MNSKVEFNVIDSANHLNSLHLRFKFIQDLAKFYKRRNGLVFDRGNQATFAKTEFFCSDTCGCEFYEWVDTLKS
jgi:hypothetical protein